ncbi:MAG: hypothetical protein M5U15_04790 [Kiritimatiellae bacterium]|nr:hypothetical protein [Kiritimatiellia bacterium]
MYSLLGVVLIAAPVVCNALSLQTGTELYLPSNGVINAQTAFYGTSAIFDGIAHDDIFALAQTIKYNGEAEGDVWLAAGEINVAGNIARHLRAAGQSFVLKGAVDGDVTAFSSSLQISTNAIIRGKLDAMAQQASLEGQFDDDVHVIATSITLAGTYGEAVRIIGKDIIVMPGTRIAGDLNYTSPKELFLDPSVVLGGKLNRLSAKQSPPSTARDYLQAAALHGAKAAAALLCGLALIALFPFYVARATREVQRSIFRCGAIGGLAFIGAPIAAIGLALSLIGLPLAAITLALYGSLLYLGKIVLALAIGSVALRINRAPGGFGQIAKMLIVGLVIIYALTFIPGFGGTIGLLIGIIGFGALVLSMVNGRAIVVRKAPSNKQPTEISDLNESNQENERG